MQTRAGWRLLGKLSNTNSSCVPAQSGAHGRRVTEPTQNGWLGGCAGHPPKAFQECQPNAEAFTDGTLRVARPVLTEMFWARRVCWLQLAGAQVVRVSGMSG